MEFREHVPIVSASGDAVGHLERVVVDSSTKVVTHIIVRKGLLNKEDKVVPISMVADANEDRVRLREDAEDLQGLPAFEEKHYVMSGDSGAGASPVISQPLSGLPGAVVSEPRQKYIKQVEQHIPAGTVALKEGAKVVSADGQQVGHVEKVITDVQSERTTHLLVSRGTLSKERKLVPITWVSIIGEDEVHLTVEPRQLEALEEHPG